MSTKNELTIAAWGEREIVMTRAFDAPRHMVFDAWTKPELLKRWLGVFNGWTLAVCEIDLRAGGKYRYVWRHPERGDMGAGGVYREVSRPDKLVQTEVFDDPWYPGEALITSVLVERDGTTTFTSTMLYESREARDGVLASPMERGVRASYDLLDQILAG
jgi:uncharacterized protein YndB with AHSA1/START domain